MGDKEELACLYSQEKTVGQIFETATVFDELDLIARINQDDDRQLLKIVKGKDEGYAGVNLQHVDEMLKCLLETFELEKEVADEMVGDKKKNVAEEHEVWEAATCGVISVGVKPIIGEMTAETTLTAATFMVEAEATSMGALKPYVFYSNNCFVSTGFIADARENLLDREIELMR